MTKMDRHGARPAGAAGENRRKKRNGPPRNTAWIWLTVDMLESEAWAAMPNAARRVVDRIAIEHMQHSGTENGNLIVTHEDFYRFGIRRNSITKAIQAARQLGFIDLTSKGVRSHGIARRPNRFALAWLPHADGRPASNRWKGITRDKADAILNGLHGNIESTPTRGGGDSPVNKPETPGKGGGDTPDNGGGEIISRRRGAA